MRQPILIGVVAGADHVASSVVRKLQQQDKNRIYSFRVITRVDSARGGVVNYYLVAPTPGHVFLVNKIVSTLNERKAINVPYDEETAQMDTSVII